MNLSRAYIRAWRYYRDDLSRIVVAVVLVALAALANLAQPFPLAILFDCVIQHKAANPLPYRLFAAVAPRSPVQQIVLLAATMLVLRLLSEAIGLAHGFYKIRIGYNGILRVRCDLFRQLQRLSLSFHRVRAQGDLIYRLGSDTNGFVAAFNVVFGIVVNAITLLFMGWIMFAMNWRLALVAVSITPFLFWAIRKYGGVLTQTSVKATEIEAQLATTVHRSVATVGLVQAFGREDDEYDRFRGDVARSSDAWVKMHMQGMVYWAVLGVCFGVGTALILGVGGYLAWQGALDVGFLWVFIQYVTMQLYTPLQALSGSETELRRGLAGMLRVYEVLDIEPDIQDAPDAIALPRRPRALELDHVSFAYRVDAPVLRDVSVTIHPGEMVAFVGSSGTGKTSLLNLLPRFYDPTDGAVRLDAHDFRKIRVRDLRGHVALVLQDSPILSATVAENIAYGNPAATEAQINQAARLAGADAFIDSLPQKFQTLLHENGQNLSGGQRQRIGIARALATDAPILVLDEPTSALDAENERMITQTLANLKGTRTIVLVSHRLSTVADCERIYMMEGGRVVEQGTHEQLLSRNGAYARMARHQVKLDDTSESLAAV
ncbi:MAG TPA: ABC transporter ATP-binding protein [Tepidisphaeraceae bacterium]|jgi:ATP-binding cassette subfamily B protein|nr:ABC transporter ATP-binding protein [Tepidisphaeraceae bacterium]